MKIGGFLKFSLIDFPHRIAAVVFTQGCNFRCHYCHNPELVLPRRFQLPIPEKEVIDLLKERYGRLDGICITGGEPLMQPDLEDFVLILKQIGYDVKLDTNGYYPAILKKFIRQGLLDFIAMDIKAAPVNYPQICGLPVNLEKITRSMQIVRESGLEYEFRTTLVKNLHTREDVSAISSLLQPQDNYVMQNFRETKRVGHKDLPLASFEPEELQDFESILKESKLNYSLR
ncbi:MAG: anaerobic ribonucleoside-triphosphate reductase activating protein [Candidatus Stygibacter frigidus]|nr:anaerobic ribonucleoside-triphosphate reductase activating protein [Candidatus Stygibacter frigidus]